MKIIITNHGSRFNKGTAALLISRIKTLHNLFPDAAFSVFTYCPHIDFSQELRNLPNISVKYFKVPFTFSLSPKAIHKNFFSVLKLLMCKADFLVKPLHLETFKDAAVVISTGGDVLTEDYGSNSLFNYVFNLLLGILLDKPVVIYAESIGPFKLWHNRIIAKILLKKVKLITLREDLSKKYVESLGINRNIVHLTADSAFLLEHTTDLRLSEILLHEGIKRGDKPLIGLSVSNIISRYGFLDMCNPRDKYRHYTMIMSQVVTHLIDVYGATVIFIPHVIDPLGNDDRAVAEDISKFLSPEHKCKIISVVNEYTAEETKGLIGYCDLFIGARMHAVIASLSMSVPAVALAYSCKTHGIIGDMLGYKKYVLDISDFSYDAIVSIIDDAWNNRKKIKAELSSKMVAIKKTALLNGVLVKKLLCDK